MNFESRGKCIFFYPQGGAHEQGVCTLEAQSESETITRHLFFFVTFCFPMISLFIFSHSNTQYKTRTRNSCPKPNQTHNQDLATKRTKDSKNKQTNKKYLQ